MLITVCVCVCVCVCKPAEMQTQVTCRGDQLDVRCSRSRRVAVEWASYGYTAPPPQLNHTCQSATTYDTGIRHFTRKSQFAPDIKMSVKSRRGRTCVSHRSRCEVALVAICSVAVLSILKILMVTLETSYYPRMCTGPFFTIF